MSQQWFDPSSKWRDAVTPTVTAGLEQVKEEKLGRLPRCAAESLRQELAAPPPSTLGKPRSRKPPAVSAGRRRACSPRSGCDPR
jgi:hypothetical protein